MADIPSPPAPTTSTTSPAASRPLRRAWSDVADEHIITAPCAYDTPAGSGTALRAGTTIASAQPPSVKCPSMEPVAQNCSRPAAQSAQAPQVTR
jgi:hypothetical protein